MLEEQLVRVEIPVQLQTWHMPYKDYGACYPNTVFQDTALLLAFPLMKHVATNPKDDM